MLSEVKVHPAAELFPMMSQVEFEELKKDIQNNSQQSPITYWGGMLLDGRNRYKACKELGIEPHEEELDEEIVKDPYQWVISQNLHRRHLDTSQRATIAAKMLKRTNGQHGKEAEQNCLASIKDAATMLNVSSRAVIGAKHVIDNGAKQLIEAVETREITASLAEKLCKVCDDKKEQISILKKGKKAVCEFVKQLTTVPPPAEEKPSRARKVLPEIVKAFRHSDNKANDLRVLIKELEPSYKALLKEWLTAT